MNPRANGPGVSKMAEKYGAAAVRMARDKRGPPCRGSWGRNAQPSGQPSKMKKKNEMTRETMIAAMLACPAVEESIRAAGELPEGSVAATLPAPADVAVAALAVRMLLDAGRIERLPGGNLRTRN